MQRTRLAILGALLLAVLLLGACTTGADSMVAPTVSEPTNTVAIQEPQSPPATNTPETAPPVMPQTAQPITKGMEAPVFSLQDLGGAQHALSDFRGKVVMLNFWASWCGFCRSEIPHMNTVYAEYADQGFEIVAVSLGEDPEHLRQFADENGMEFVILPDVDGITVPIYLVQSIPTSYFLSKDGTVQAIYNGAIQEETLRTIVKTLLTQ